MEGAILALAGSDLLARLVSRIEHPGVLGLSLLALAGTFFGGPFPETGNWPRVEVHCALVGAGPVVLGRLMRSRREIAEQFGNRHGPDPAVS
ncbi:hypothetical protein [Streptomyces roseifaciens]|uniref:hypothetical protein n=1 Tax=Streptomyces roseifaciens TaxID=1488406 RepID=UPI00071800BC|nr:hypothetical protein [Streptomyces roseifaciens]